MRTLKTTVIAALLVPAFAVSAFAFDHHEGDGQDAKMKAKKAEHMQMMKEKCAKSEDTKKCMADMKAAKMKKKMEKKKGKMEKKAKEHKADHE